MPVSQWVITRLTGHLHYITQYYTEVLHIFQCINHIQNKMIKLTIKKLHQGETAQTVAISEFVPKTTILFDNLG